MHLEQEKSQIQPLFLKNLEATSSMGKLEVQFSRRSIHISRFFLLRSFLRLTFNDSSCFGSQNETQKEPVGLGRDSICD